MASCTEACRSWRYLYVLYCLWPPTEHTLIWNRSTLVCFVLFFSRSSWKFYFTTPRNQAAGLEASATPIDSGPLSKLNFPHNYSQNDILCMISEMWIISRIRNETRDYKRFVWGNHGSHLDFTLCIIMQYIIIIMYCAKLFLAIKSKITVYKFKVIMNALTQQLKSDLPKHITRYNRWVVSFVCNTVLVITELVSNCSTYTLTNIRIYVFFCPLGPHSLFMLTTTHWLILSTMYVCLWLAVTPAAAASLLNTSGLSRCTSSGSISSWWKQQQRSGFPACLV